MDQDMQKGLRAMISGGLYQLEDEQLEKLIAGAADAQRQRGQAPVLDEVKYLEEYLVICEDAAQYYTEEDSYLPRRFAEALEELNATCSAVACILITQSGDGQVEDTNDGRNCDGCVDITINPAPLVGSKVHHCHQEHYDAQTPLRLSF